MTKLFKILIVFLAICQSAYCYNLSSNEIRQEIFSQVEKEAKENLKNFGVEYKIELSQIPFSNFETGENSKPKIEVISQSPKFQPNSVKRVVIKNSNGITLKTFALSTKISIFKEVLVSSELIQFNQEISLRNCKIEKREISKYLGKTFSNVPQNLIAKRNYQKGAIILNEGLGEKSAILKNSTIDIIFLSDKGLMIKLQGRALKDGAIGEKILVRSDKYNKIYSAIVNSANEVTVRI